MVEGVVEGACVSMEGIHGGVMASFLLIILDFF